MLDLYFDEFRNFCRPWTDIQKEQVAIVIVVVEEVGREDLRWTD